MNDQGPPPPPQTEPEMTEESFDIQRRGGGRGKILALLFGVAAGIGAGKYVWKPAVTLQQFEAVKAKGAATQSSLTELKTQLAELQKSYAGQTCFANEGDPGFEKAKQMVLAAMDGGEIESLSSKELAKTMTYLTKNKNLWRVNADTLDDRFDGDVAEVAIGKYRGTWKVAFPGAEPTDLTFDLEINGFQSSDEPNVVRYRDADGTFKSTIEFRYRLLGTNPDKKRMHLVLDNAFKESQKEVPYFGFRFPAQLKSKQKARGKILGLTPDRKWQVIGEYTLQRL